MDAAQATSAMRTCLAGELSAAHKDRDVSLCGWVDRCRDHGGVIFIDLRDRGGTAQVTVNPDGNPAVFATASCATKPSCGWWAGCGCDPRTR